MNKEQIKEFLKKIETAPNTFGVIGNERLTAINALAKSVPITWFEQFAKMVEQEVLISVENQCQSLVDDMIGIQCSNQQIYGASQIVETVRSMKISD